LLDEEGDWGEHDDGSKYKADRASELKLYVGDDTNEISVTEDMPEFSCHL
jgi:hypothetical protein